MHYTTIDLNADLGETEGDYLDLLPLVTSANVACGGHAGGGQLLKETIAAALSQGVQIGAHPAYPDRENFGRKSMRGEIEDLVAIIAEQINIVVQELANYGQKLSHVKAHGALYNDAMVHEDVAQSVINAVAMASPGTRILGLPNSTLNSMCIAQGIGFTAEGFLDRAYEANGTLVPRSQSGAVLSHDEALKQIHELISFGTVTAKDGTKLQLAIQTLCVHADTPGAAETAAEVKKLLVDLGVKVKAF